MSAGGEGTAAVRCPACGAGATTGNFCSRCGERLGESEGSCAECGARLKAGALYCQECGTAVGRPARKAARSHLPWILSGLALVAFSVVIALLVQRQTAPRTPGGVMTGGIPGSSEGTAGVGGNPAAQTPSGGMPSMEELMAMSPRERADRLFERAMREHEGGDFARTAQFIQMGLQAYGQVPPDQMDADGRFHVGLLQLVAGDAAGASESAETILRGDSDHLLGLILGARVADFEQDEAEASRL
ncbi:MAG: zinc ribbon domain-containing protein, partial [Gemmatimonadota bacterium]|nr:zinc ribbon domain-containing protein [Gemmatimonadota bacterium]